MDSSSRRGVNHNGAHSDHQHESDKGKGKAKQYYQGQAPPDTVASEETWPLSMNKPYTHLVTRKHQVQPPYNLVLPAKIRNLLPKATVPVILSCGNKNWSMRYFGNCSGSQRLDAGWKSFAIENKLKVGDGCVFELSECSAQGIKFRVQILDGDLPFEILVRTDGRSLQTPITID